MKYDILCGFKEYLSMNVSPNTAKTYYSAVNSIFQEFNFDRLEEVPCKEITRKLQNLSSKNKVSAAKNGLKHLKKYDDSLQLPSEADFSQIMRSKRNRVKSRGKKVDFDKMLRQVNAVKNEKLKLAFRLAAVSGLRVSELAALESSDLHFDGESISVFVRSGKGGKSGSVDCLQDAYLNEQLKLFCEKSPEGRIFYSESYMRKKAHQLGFEMHDFRRAFAVLKKKQCLAEGDNVQESNEEVQAALRHSKFSTTKRYLYGRRIVTSKKFTSPARHEADQLPEKSSDRKIPDPYDFTSIFNEK